MSPHVVPAKAGTHYHKYRLVCEAGATARFNNATLWLWVPAFAGTTGEAYSAAAFCPGLPTKPAGSPNRSIITAVRSLVLLVTQAPERTV